jgi:hypothetical protein
MSRRKHGLDRNHREIEDCLRAWGCSVQSLAGMGDGVPDLLVGRKVDGQPRNFVLEVKSDAKKDAAKQLRTNQRTWALSWRGQVATVRTVREALLAVGINPGRARPCQVCECRTDEPEPGCNCALCHT